MAFVGILRGFILKTVNNTIAFPRVLNSETIGTLSEQIKRTVLSLPRHKMEIYFDVALLEFIEPLAMTVLFDQTTHLKKSNIKVFISNYTNGSDLSKAVCYMDDSEFFLQISGRSLRPDSCCRQSTLPIRSLEPNETLMWLENVSMNWLANRLGTHRDSLAEIKICIEELFNNTKDHSGVRVSTAFIQHFPNKGEIKICISDLGIGLVTKIQRAHPDFTPLDCIIHAIREGFTTRSSYRNAGMGLFTLACMVCNNGGKFILRTGCISAIVYRGAEGLPSVNIQTDCPHIDGTAFEITLYQDNLDLLQSTSEDFSWE